MQNLFASRFAATTPAQEKPSAQKPPVDIHGGKENDEELEERIAAYQELLQ